MGVLWNMTIQKHISDLRKEYVTATEERKSQIKRTVEFMNDPNAQIHYMTYKKVIWNGKEYVNGYEPKEDGYEQAKIIFQA